MFFQYYFPSNVNFLDHDVEHKFITPLARRILIFASTTDQLIDQLQAFVPEIDPTIYQINWSAKESSRKLKLHLILLL